ncbi:MAG: hypothetical protein E8D42_01805 [Nitrospira sp.]|nr:MAG: hypothetical protein E8D42_01805 [Nitrospira sp.]
MPKSSTSPSRSSSPLPKRKARRLEPQDLDLNQYGPWDEQRAVADLVEKLRSRYPMSYRGRGVPAIRREMLFNVSDRVANRIRKLKTPVTQGRAIQLFKEELKKDGYLVGAGLHMTEKVVRDYVKRIRLQQKPMGRFTRNDWMWMAKYSRDDRFQAIKILKKLLADDEEQLKKFGLMRTECPSAVLPPVFLGLEKACQLRIAATRDVLSAISS